MGMPLILPKLDFESSVLPLFYFVLLIFLDCFDLVERVSQIIHYMIAFSWPFEQDGVK